MSLPLQVLTSVPAQTALVAQQAFSQGNRYLQMHHVLGTIYEDDLFAAAYFCEGHPALHPWQLALFTVMQFAENLTDRQATYAVRGRIDWKYLGAVQEFEIEEWILSGPSFSKRE